MTEIHHNFCWVITGYNWKWVSSYKLDSSSLSNGNKAKKVHVCGIQWKMEIKLFSIWYIYSLIKSQKLFFLSFLPKVYKYINLVFGPFLQNRNSYETQQTYIVHTQYMYFCLTGFDFCTSYCENSPNNVFFFLKK